MPAQTTTFDTLASLIGQSGPGAAFEHLARSSREVGNFAQLFEARLLAARHRLGLPLVTAGPPAGASEEQRRQYDEAVMAAARETGALFLESGNIARAWPYYRALGDPAPIADAIAKSDGGEDPDPLIEIALGERVLPLRGLELVLAHHGTCRAITLFDQYPDPATRDDALRVLVGTLHGELRANLIRTIAQHEGAEPAAVSIPELIADRPWLFGEYDYYVDTSHLISILRYAAESADPAVLTKSIELARYGARLAPTFHHKGEPPLDDVYDDHRIWLAAFLSPAAADAAVEHFRAKIEAIDLDETGSYPAQVFVRFLVRLERYKDAIAAFERWLTGTDPAYLMCPNLYELCRLARDWPRLRDLAEQRNDPITFAAAVLEHSPRAD